MVNRSIITSPRKNNRVTKDQKAGQQKLQLHSPMSSAQTVSLTEHSKHRVFNTVFYSCSNTCRNTPFLSCHNSWELDFFFKWIQKNMLIKLKFLHMSSPAEKLTGRKNIPKDGVASEEAGSLTVSLIGKVVQWSEKLFFWMLMTLSVFLPSIHPPWTVPLCFQQVVQLGSDLVLMAIRWHIIYSARVFTL